MKNQVLGTAFLATAISLVGCSDDGNKNTSNYDDNNKSSNISNNINGVLDGYYLDDNYNSDNYVNKDDYSEYGYKEKYTSNYDIDNNMGTYTDSNYDSYNFGSYFPNDASGIENYYADSNMNGNLVDYTYDDFLNNNYSSSDYMADYYLRDGSEYEYDSTYTTYDNLYNSADYNTDNYSYNTDTYDFLDKTYSERFGWGMKGAENIVGNQDKNEADYSEKTNYSIGNETSTGNNNYQNKYTTYSSGYYSNYDKDYASTNDTSVSNNMMDILKS